jgi:hypothetical protein
LLAWWWWGDGRWQVAGFKIGKCGGEIDTARDSDGAEPGFVISGASRAIARQGVLGRTRRIAGDLLQTQAKVFIQGFGVGIVDVA